MRFNPKTAALRPTEQLQMGGGLPDEPPPALLSRLERLAGRSAGAGQDVAAGGSALEQILAEIDDIMLPRELVVYGEGGALARLVISQRRLVGLALIEGWRGDLLDGLRRLLVLCGGAPVQFQRYVTQAPIGAESLSTDAIRRRLAPSAEPCGTPMERFAATVAPLAAAWLQNGETGQEALCGEKDAQEMLRVWAAQVPHLQGLGARPDAMILPASGVFPDHRLLVARAAQARFLALFPAPALAEVGTLWQVAFGGACDHPPRGR